MSILNKIRSRKEGEKKIIIGAVALVFGVLLFNFYLKAFAEKVKREDVGDIGSQVQFPDIGKMVDDVQNPDNAKSIPPELMPFLKRNP
jgi:hypothetical protein